MNKEIHKQILFYTRMILYLLAFCMPFIHPSIVVHYDFIGIWFWFIIVPVEMLIAFYASPPKINLFIWLSAAVLFPLITMFFVIGLSFDVIMFTGGGITSFLLTVLVFKTKGRGKSIAVLEVFLLGIIYFKLLSFSRASSELAAQSSEITKVFLILSICAFFLHCIVLYLALFKQKKLKKQGRELIIFSCIVIPLLLVIAFAMPADFIENIIELNQIDEDKIPEGVELEDLYNPNGNPDENGQNGKLEGIDAEEWSLRFGENGEGERKQYAVMIVASKLNTIYAAREYFGILDPEKGFVFSENNRLNELSSLRVIETWRNKDLVNDLSRRENSMYFLSKEPFRFLAYEPLSFEPTILNYRYYPFSYSYNATSNITLFNYRDWEKIQELNTYGEERENEVRELNEFEKEEFKEYLDVPISDELKAGFLAYIENNVNEDDKYMYRLISILQGFGIYQYNLGYTDEVTVDRIDDFLTIDKEGDCTEFSNSTAILTRMVGIPSRVVTGYLVSKNLQSPMHYQALIVLKQAIRLLDEFPINDLALVTTSHRHSWAQVFIPDYGWIDVEATSYAIPPPPGSDPNSMDLVIPIISDKERNVRPGFVFPWRTAVFVLLFFVCGSMIFAFIYRYLKEAYLSFSFKNMSDVKALKSIYLLMLMKLAASGYRIKNQANTPVEYSKVYPEIRDFADIYTRLRYSENLENYQRKVLREELHAEYKKIIENSRQPGIWNIIKRIFSLRGLLY